MQSQPLSRKIIITSDGSHTIHVPQLGEHYHSIHGAVQESEHVFIQTGVAPLKELSTLRILEIGFGTGLNALLTLKYASENELKIAYTSIEKYPLQPNEYKLLNYGKVLGGEWEKPFIDLHECQWEKEITIKPQFVITKKLTDLMNVDFENHFNLIFFDAFGPDVQPDLWTEAVFQKMFRALTNGGKLVTYSAKGQVRRNLVSAGFRVERLPGPPGKREMLRASKKSD